MIFLCQHNLILKHPIIIPPLRENDWYIMQALLDINIPRSDLITCNLCRLYLKVCLLSEIVNGDGTCLLDGAWLGTEVATAHKAKSWPSYNKPPASMWHTWQKWLSKAFLIRGRRLRKSLGRWIEWDEHWEWYTTHEGSLYSYREGKWQTHWPMLLRNRLSTYTREGNPCNRPSSLRRATIYEKGNRIVCTGSDSFLLPVASPPASFTEFLLEWCTQHLVVDNEGKDLALEIRSGISGTVMAVSDGSYKDSYGTAAWTIGTEDMPHIIAGKAICPGGADDHSSYRSKLTGLYAILAIVNQLCAFYKVEEGTIRLAVMAYPRCKIPSTGA
jgi:hypothetical protein